MRQPQHNQHGRKPRGRSRKTHNPLSRVYDSNGPDTKIRGTATHIAEKYQSLARDAFSAGERIIAENYLQHAEHYLRIVATAQASIQPQEQTSSGDQTHQGRSDNRNNNNADVDAAGDGETRSTEDGSSDQRQHSGNQQGRNRRGNRRRPYNADGEGSRNQPPGDAAIASEAIGGEVPASLEQSPVAISVSPIDTPSSPEPVAALPSDDEASANGVPVRKPRAKRVKAEVGGDAPLAPKRRTRRKPKVSDEGEDQEAAAAPEKAQSDASDTDASSSEPAPEPRIADVV